MQKKIFNDLGIIKENNKAILNYDEKNYITISKNEDNSRATRGDCSTYYFYLV